jgi:hypothetical protein
VGCGGGLFNLFFYARVAPMRRVILSILLTLFLPAGADTVVSGAISSDTTWSPSGGVYIIDSNFSVLPGVTLTIEPGTIIKARTTGMGGPSIYGNLIAFGTEAEPIYFTSIWDDSIGGDTDGTGPSVSTPGEWQGLYFKEGSVGELDHVVVRYSGYGGYGYGNFVGIENDGGIIDIRNSNIHDNYRIVSDGAGGSTPAGTGIYNKSGTFSISDSVIERQNTGIYVISGTSTITSNIIRNHFGTGFVANGEGVLTLIDNVFSGNKSTGSLDIAKPFIHSGNTSSDINYRGFITGGIARDGMVLESTDLPILVFGRITVEVGETMTIAPGTILKFGSYPWFGAIEVLGTLVAHGTVDDKIYFTSIYDDSVGGDTNGDGDTTTPAPRNWNAIYLENGSRADFDNIVLRYSGYNYNGEYLPGVATAIYQRGAEFSISNSLFEQNWISAIYQDAGTTAIDHSEFRGQSLGIWSRGGNIAISQSSLHDNTAAAIYNESNLLIDARNNWWGSADGPQDSSTSTPTGSGDRIGGSVLYIPWLTSDPLLSPTRNPVIIVPGIMGSYLEREDGTEVWMNLLKMALPGDDSYLDELKLSIGGEPTNDLALVLRDILREVLSKNFFDGMIDHFESIGYQEGIDLFVFPYDWRLDITTTIEKLLEKINQIKLQPEVQKVDIVAHSMGGLIAKEYLKNYGGNLIDKFIDIGTPQLGSPNAFKVLSYGDNLNISIGQIEFVNPNRIKIISQNMPSVYQLLPTREYFDMYPSYVSDLDDLDNNGVRGNLSYDQTKDFLKNTGRNGLLVDRADEFHQGIADLDPADYGVETYNIVGCGVQTLGRIFILNKESSGGVEYNISYTNGDGTVPLKSAEHIPALKTYYAKNAVHATMPSLTGVKELIASILSGDEDFDILLYPNLAESANGCTIPNGRVVSFHSPIELHIYSNGNHAGPNVSGDVEVNIPGVSYEVIDGNKFAFLPDGVEYTITGNATEAGTFNARIKTVEDGDVTETRYFNQVPIVATTQVEVTEDKIIIDNESDGVFELTFPVSSVLDENQSSDVTKPVTSVEVIGKRKRGEPFTAPVKVVLSATDDNSGVLKTEYSVNDGQNWALYVEPFTVNTRGRTHLLYRSTDRAGNIEVPKFVDIDISKKIR